MRGTRTSRLLPPSAILQPWRAYLIDTIVLFHACEFSCESSPGHSMLLFMFSLRPQPPKVVQNQSDAITPSRFTATWEITSECVRTTVATVMITVAVSSSIRQTKSWSPPCHCALTIRSHYCNIPRRPSPCDKLPATIISMRSRASSHPSNGAGQLKRSQHRFLYSTHPTSVPVIKLHSSAQSTVCAVSPTLLLNATSSSVYRLIMADLSGAPFLTRGGWEKCENHGEEACLIGRVETRTVQTALVRVQTVATTTTVYRNTTTSVEPICSLNYKRPIGVLDHRTSWV